MSHLIFQMRPQAHHSHEQSFAYTSLLSTLLWVPSPHFLHSALFCLTNVLSLGTCECMLSIVTILHPHIDYCQLIFLHHSYSYNTHICQVIPQIILQYFWGCLGNFKAVFSIMFSFNLINKLLMAGTTIINTLCAIIVLNLSRNIWNHRVFMFSQYAILWSLLTGKKLH